MGAPMPALICSLPAVASLLTHLWASIAPACPPVLSRYLGYVEGEYVLVAPVEAAQITTVAVRRGERVAQGQVLAGLDHQDVDASVAQARAAKDVAQAQLANLTTGRRPEEIQVLEAALKAAKAQATEAASTMLRIGPLFDRGVASHADFDSASSGLKTANANLAAAEANLEVGQLPARPEEIASARANVAQTAAALDLVLWRQGKRILVAPKPGVIADVVRYPGELAGPQAPVLSFLPDGATKLRLFIPEKDLSLVQIGGTLDVHCDGCNAHLTAQINFISTGPEFTPPVIYSHDNRQTLMYAIEAKPDAMTVGLQPGQLVDVTLGGDP